MDVLVVGAGAMGRWLGAVLAADGPGVDLAYLDADPAAAAEAARATGGRAVGSETDERFAAVCVAVPIPVVTEAIAAYADRASQAVLDVTGTMREPVAAMREHAPDRERASFHPLFAPENEPGSVPLVADEPGAVTDAVRSALEARGNRVFETTPAEHDEAMETVQARTHAAVLAYALAAEPVDERFHTPISGELAALAEQVLGGDPRVYADIQASFDGAADIAEAARRIAEADTDTFERLYGDAGR